MSDDSYFYYWKDIWVELHGGLPQDDYNQGSLEPLIYIQENEETSELIIYVDMPLLDANTLRIDLIKNNQLLIEASLKNHISSNTFHAGLLSKDLKKYHVLISLPNEIKRISRITIRKDVVVIRLK